MKAIIIRVAIVLFVRWLKKNDGIFSNTDSWLNHIFAASSHKELIDALEDERAEKFIDMVVTDIEDETISNVISDIIGDKKNE